MSDSQTDDIAQWNPVDAILLPIFRRPIPAAIAGLAVLAVALAYALIQPDEYRSTAAIAFKKPSFEAMGENQFRISDELKLEQRILTDDYTLEITAEELGPERILQPYDPAKHTDSVPWLKTQLRRVQSWYFAWVARGFELPESATPAELDLHEKRLIRAARKHLAENLEVDLDYASPVLELNYVAHSPELAQETLEAILEGYRQRREQLFPEQLEDRKQLAEDQSETARRTLERLTRFKQTNGISDLDAQLERVTGRLEEVKAEVRDLGSDQSLQKQYIAQLESQRDSMKPTKTEFEMIPNWRFKQQQTEVSRLEEEVRDLSELVSARAPQLLELEAELRTAKETLEGMQPLVRTNEREVLNPEYRERENEILGAKFDLAKIEEKLVNLRADQLDLERRSDRLIELAPEYGELEQDALDEESLARRLREEVRTAEVLRSGGEAFDVYGEPTIPLEKTGPKRIKFVLAGLFAALFVAFGLAIVLDLLSKQVRSINELQKATGAPVLAVVGVATGVRRARSVSQRRPLSPTTGPRRGRQRPEASLEEVASVSPDPTQDGGAL